MKHLANRLNSQFLLAAPLTAILMMMLTACGGKDEGGNVTASAQRAVLISTASAKVADIPVWFESVGQVRAHSAPTIAAEVGGRITRVLADAGDRIKAGQLLAETDTSTLLLQQQAAEANLERLAVHIENAERRVARFEKLSSQNLSSQTQLDDTREQLEAYRAERKAAVAQLAIVQDSLNKSRVVAPTDGVIQGRMISEGDFVNRGQPLFSVTQPERLQAWLPFPEAVALKVHIGQRVDIFSPLTPGETFTTEITDLEPTIGNGSRAVTAIVDLDQPGALKPGATLTCKLLVETRNNAVLAPSISVVRRPAGDVVYVINGDRAEARVVETGAPDGAWVEIRSGLDGNETLATDGAAFLTDGASVTIQEPQT
jgi:RND family efflux transporter MFP subunit